MAPPANEQVRAVCRSLQLGRCSQHALILNNRVAVAAMEFAEALKPGLGAARHARFGAAPEPVGTLRSVAAAIAQVPATFHQISATLASIAAALRGNASHPMSKASIGILHDAGAEHGVVGRSTYALGLIEAARVSMINVLDRYNNADLHNTPAYEQMLGLLHTTGDAVAQAEEWLLSHVHHEACLEAVRTGSLHALVTARGSGYAWDEAVSTLAARLGRIELLGWMRAQDPPCPVDAGACVAAVLSNRLETLQWLRDPANGLVAPWDADTCAIAAESEDRLGILHWMTRVTHPPCPWDARVPAAAARVGALLALVDVRAKHPHHRFMGHRGACPWDATAANAAVDGGHLHVLQWMRPEEDVGRGICPWDRHIGARAAERMEATRPGTDDRKTAEAVLEWVLRKQTVQWFQG
jgi:hypothetical protein